jgi:DNA-binding transcriptional ArsR family regulator
LDDISNDDYRSASRERGMDMWPSHGAPEPGGPLLEKAVVLLRGMAYEHRLHILLMLQKGEQTPSAIARALSAEPTTVSHHLRFLRQSRLIQRRRHGRQIYYTLGSEAIGRLVSEVLRCVDDVAGNG